MLNRIFGSICLILCSLQWTGSVALAVDTSSPDDVTVMKCEDIQYVGAQHVELHYDGNELRLIGFADDKNQFIIATTKPEKKVYGRVDDGDCDGNTVWIREKWGFKSVYITQTYKWDGKKLYQIQTEVYDPSSKSIDSALDEALKGNLEKAISHLEEVMYPWNYLGCGTIEEFLEKGYKASFSIQNTRGSKQAATALENTFELMSEAYNYSRMSEPQIEAPAPTRWVETFERCQIPASKYIPAINDFGFFLHRAGKNEKAADILLLAISKDPKRTIAYLNLADIYWSLGKRRDAIDNYKQYRQMMISSEKAGKVPRRVKRRLKANP